MLNKIRQHLRKINDSYEFKPLLSEIEESPVSPLGRFTFWTVVSLIIITILWLIIGKIDIVITARGIVIPDGEAKIIQPLETGVIKEILVKEGDFVRKDQLLVLIDTMTTDAQLKTVKENLETSKEEAKRLEAQGLEQKFNSKDEAQKNLYNESLKALNSLIGAKNQEIKQIERQIDSNLAQKRDYENQLQSSIDREKRLENVKDIVAYNDVKEAQDRTIALRESVNRTEAEIKRLQAQKRQIQNEIAQLKADFKAQKLENLTETNKRIKELEASKEQIEFSNINQKITAPVDGYVDKLMVHTIGGVVTPAQELIALTPADIPLLIKATVLNKDIGFIKPDMPVSIKIDTYDFQKYGLLHGKVKSISQNSIENEELGPVYEIYITLDKNTLIIDGKEQKISTGMTLNAEIEIGKRRIIEFFIYPLIKYMDEGVSVR
jgi:hemolysin D